MSAGRAAAGPGSRVVGRYRVPAGASPALRWFVDAVWTPRSRRERWLGRVAERLPARAALALLARGGHAGAAPERAETGRRLLEAAIGGRAAGASAVGWTGYAGTGRALEFVFAAGEAEPRWVLKWGRRGELPKLADEGERLATVRGRLVGEAGGALAATLPEPLARGAEAEHEWLLLSALGGRTMDADLGRAPRDGARSRRHLELAAEWLARFHLATGAGADAAPRAAGGPAPEPGLEELAGAVTAGEVRLAVRHGDYWPRNILVSPGLERVTGVVDWESARTDALAQTDLFDLALSYAALVVGGDRVERAVNAFRLAILTPEALAGGVRAGFAAYARIAGLEPRWLEPLFRLYLSELAAGARELRLVPAPDRAEVARTWIALLGETKRSVFSG